MISLVNYIAESKALHQNVNIAEKLIVNKNYNISKSPATVDDLKNEGWKKVNLHDVDPKYFDVDINNKKCSRRLYNKDGSPSQWFLWWMILCMYGPMSKAELFKYCYGVEGATSHSSTWANMGADNIISYNTKLRKSEPKPMSEWTIWK